MDMSYNNGDRSPSTDEEAGLKLASEYPKRQAGRKKFKETRHPVYRGIRQRNSDKWVCEVRQPKTTARLWLGTFPTAEMAARAHDVAVIALRGRHGACLNFADSAWRLRVPVSNDTKDIQRAAAEAAEEFRPVETVAVAEMEMEMENVFYMEDDEVGLGDMYQELGIPPPPGSCSWGSYGGYDDVDCETADVSLWSYSI
ncbi:dehydration-responsive element-binding protein 1D-like [Silene latifolia]|uniref:dehydration-responsive element-binding protein 1D-like n=1 Tax=Silene latifolia TaxID=37657 RepID=UPI003D774A04